MASRRCGATWRRSVVRPSSGGYFRQPWASAESELRAWFAAECAARGLTVETDGIGNQVAWWVARERRARDGVLTGSHLDSVLDGGAYDGPLGVAPRWPRSTCCGRGASSRPPDRRLGLRRGGGVALRPRLPRLPAGHRRDHWDEARELRDRDGVFLADAVVRRGPGSVAGAAVAGPGRDLRRASRRAGSRPRRPRPRRRAGQRDLAARPLAIRLRRAGQPRRHDPHGGPARPDAELCDDRAGRQQAGQAWPASARPSGGSRSSPTAPTPSPRS